MSRSRKKVGGYKDRNKGMKAIANRKVRRSKVELPEKGRSYKKLFCTWNICDYKFLYFSKNELIFEIEKWSFFLDKDNDKLYKYYTK